MAEVPGLPNLCKSQIQKRFLHSSKVYWKMGLVGWSREDPRLGMGSPFPLNQD